MLLQTLQVRIRNLQQQQQQQRQRQLSHMPMQASACSVQPAEVHRAVIMPKDHLRICNLQQQ
jgi:hypothetical protein